MTERAPSVSAVVPTLNAERHLDACLRSLRAQDYAGELEIVLVDAGSTDATLAIAERHGVERVLANPLRSGEAGKAVGVKAARGELVLLLDSDNALVGADWLTRMVRPFVEDDEVVGCEPARFAYVRSDYVVNRWHALLGAADPLTIFLGTYARESVLTGSWTGCPHVSSVREGWERVELDPAAVPVLGANGFVVRARVLAEHGVGDYLFDVDLVAELVRDGRRVFARVDSAVHHAFCDSVASFRKKTRRRVDDYFYFTTTGEREAPAERRLGGIVRFTLSTLLVFPVVRDAARGQRRSPDLRAWAWHPLACWITLLVYARGVARGRLRPRMLDRGGWRQ